MKKDQVLVTLEVLGLRAKFVLMTVIQLFGFALILYGFYRMATVGLIAKEAMWLNPMAVERMFASAVADDLVLIGLGIAIVWIATR